jgi:hypothetical protein
MIGGGPTTCPAFETTTDFSFTGLVNVCLAELVSLKLSAKTKKLSVTTKSIATGIPQISPASEPVKWSWNCWIGFAPSAVAGHERECRNGRHEDCA